MDKYMHVERSDLLFEAIPELIKNMLLVMDSAQVFISSEGYLPLWHVTWDRINSFLPGLKEEFFKAQSPKIDEQPSGPVPINIPSTLPEPTLTKSSVSPPVPPPAPPAAPSLITSLATSIIFQSPYSSYGHTYTTPIFNHLGQQTMTTSISGQPPSLVPSKPFFIPSIIPTIPAEPIKKEPIISFYSTAEPLYIPPTSNIFAPVQMYSTAGSEQVLE